MDYPAIQNCDKLYIKYETFFSFDVEKSENKKQLEELYDKVADWLLTPAKMLNTTEPPANRHHTSLVTRLPTGRPANARSSPMIPTTANSINAGRKSDRYPLLAEKKAHSVNAQAVNSSNTAAANQRNTDTSGAGRIFQASGAAKASQTIGQWSSTPQ